MEINFKEFNLILAYLWNQVDRKHFKELIEIAIGQEVQEDYLEMEWVQFQKCPPQFLYNFRELFEAVCTAIEVKNYKG